MTAARGETASVIAGARLTGADRLDPFGDAAVDVHLADGRIVDIAPAGALPRHGLIVDAEGGWVIPGLWDHHVHTVQWALAARREPLDGVATAAEAAARMGAVTPGADDRRVGTGFRDALWPDAPSLDLLDRATGEVPTYLINADVHSVWLNSAALRREGMHTPDGMLREEPAFEISRRLNATDPLVADRLVDDALRAAAARGVTGVVDLDMAWNAEAWVRRRAAGFDAMRIAFAIYPDHLERAIAEGLATGDALDADGLVRVGSLKVISDGSLGTRTAYCTHPYPDHRDGHGVLTVPYDRLVELMTAATAAGLQCAIHAIGDLAATHALDAFALTQATGTLEHAQLLAAADIPRFARLGVGASVQPEHAVDDRDMTDAIWATQTGVPYPLRALADAGANLLLGSDAPVSPLDPWAAMAAAVHRTRDGREPWRPEQALDSAVALAASTHGGSDAGSALAPGMRADLTVVDRDPLVASEPDLRATRVAATTIEGRLTHVA